MNSDSLDMVSRLGEGHMPCNFFLSEPQLKTTVVLYEKISVNLYYCTALPIIRTVLKNQAWNIYKYVLIL